MLVFLRYYFILLGYMFILNQVAFKDCFILVVCNFSLFGIVMMFL